MAHLKAHKFFEGIDFTALNTMKAPIIIRTVRGYLGNTSSFHQESTGCPD